MENANSIEPTKMDKTKSITHALSVLNDAASESSDEIRRMVSKDFRRIRDTFADHKPEVRGALRDIRDVATDSVSQLGTNMLEGAKGAARQVDARARENPWVFAGVAGAIAAAMGFFLGRRSSK